MTAVPDDAMTTTNEAARTAGERVSAYVRGAAAARQRQGESRPPNPRVSSLTPWVSLAYPLGNRHA